MGYFKVVFILLVHTLKNATLAGGVAIGSCCNLMVTPGGALIIGTIAGCVCTNGMHFGSPFLARVFKVHDVSSVHNLHGLPAIVACFSRFTVWISKAISNCPAHHALHIG